MPCGIHKTIVDEDTIDFLSIEMAINLHMILVVLSGALVPALADTSNVYPVQSDGYIPGPPPPGHGGSFNSLNVQPVYRPQPAKTNMFGQILQALLRRQESSGGSTGTNTNSGSQAGVHPMEQAELYGTTELGLDGTLKIMLAIFPFILPLIFVPLLLVTMGVLLIPFVAYDNFRSFGKEARSGHDPWPHEMYLRMLDSVNFNQLLKRIF